MKHQQQGAEQNSTYATLRKGISSYAFPREIGGPDAQVEDSHQGDADDHGQRNHLPAFPQLDRHGPADHAEQAAQYKKLSRKLMI